MVNKMRLTRFKNTINLITERQDVCIGAPAILLD